MQSLCATTTNTIIGEKIVAWKIFKILIRLNFCKNNLTPSGGQAKQFIKFSQLDEVQKGSTEAKSKKASNKQQQKWSHNIKVRLTADTAELSHFLWRFRGKDVLFPKYKFHCFLSPCVFSFHL